MEEHGTKMNSIPDTVLICFSHLRWDFVYQRPQHLMSRLGKVFRTFYVEEPLSHHAEDSYQIKLTGKNVWVVTPLLNSAGPSSTAERQQRMIEKLLTDKMIHRYIFWYYTPMALMFSRSLKPELIVYDCMDELSAFKFAPAELKQLEAELLGRADLVFTGGKSLFDAKKDSHHNMHLFPSSIDKEHFSRSRTHLAEPPDQQRIPHPRFGFYGVIDERFDIDLIRTTAEKRPDWHFVLVGPVVKISADELPTSNNIHYLGSKSYDELPYYLSGWDIAMIPFAKNGSTRFISPTKTPEYLAGGRPVISTSITDVVHAYGDNGLVHIADDAEQFIAVAEEEFARTGSQVRQWLGEVDATLKNDSWDQTAGGMISEIGQTMKQGRSSKKIVA